MINVITELSKYVILTLMIVYTFHCFYMVWRQDEEEKRELLHQQLTMIFFIDFTAFLVIYLKSMDFRVILFYIENDDLFCSDSDPLSNYLSECIAASFKIICVCS